MSRKVEYFILIMLVGSLACNEIDIPEPKEEEPTFHFTFSEDSGLPIDFTAGREDYFMYTSYQEDNQKVLVFSGEFRHKDCSSNCPNSIGFQVRNNSRGVFNPEKAFESGDRPYFLRTDYFDSVVVQLAPGPDLTSAGARVCWEVSNTQSRCDNTLKKEIRIHRDDRVKVWLNTTRNDHCVTSAWRYISLDSTDRCATVVVAETNERRIKLTARVTGGQAPFTYKWSTGDTKEAIEVPLKSTGAISVVVTDVNGCMSGYSIKVNAASNDVACPMTGIHIESIKPIVRRDLEQLGAAQVVYRNAAGVLFSTAWGPQDEGAVFRIKRVMDFKENDAGQPTKLLDVVINARLYNAEGKFFRIRNAEGTIALAYPK